MPILELSPRPSRQELAASLIGLVAANLVAIRERPEITTNDLRRLKYRRRERPDRWTGIVRSVEIGEWDCEDAMAGWGALLAQKPAARIRGWLGIGGPNLEHAFLTEENRVFDGAVISGMAIPPDRVYARANAILICDFREIKRCLGLR